MFRSPTACGMAIRCRCGNKLLQKVLRRCDISRGVKRSVEEVPGRIVSLETLFAQGLMSILRMNIYDLHVGREVHTSGECDICRWRVVLVIISDRRRFMCGKFLCDSRLG